MDITVSSPGSPGTSFTDNIKDQILIIADVLEKNEDFASVRDLRARLENYGMNQNYTRNIFPFLQNCGIVKYRNGTAFKNIDFFTNIGKAYVDILRCIKIIRNEAVSPLRDEILKLLEKIQEEIYFQCLVIMMKNPDCNYGYDFYDVLRFVNMYESIDSTEYLLIQHERAVNPGDYIQDMGDTVRNYRAGVITINVKTKTKNDENGSAKSVNSFPYVHGNFIKSGVFYKGKDERYYIVGRRMPEVINAIQEVRSCLNSAKKQ
ncbi:MAG: hypothetical protein ACI4XF_09140 [Oscillospiraceae bacterium]